MLITGALVAYLCWRGLTEHLFGQRGYLLVTTGIGLILMGLLLDLSDDFDFSRRYVYNGHAVYADYLRWYGGYALGGLLILVGFAQWVPIIVTLRDVERDLTRSNEGLQKEISARARTEAELQRIKSVVDAATDFVGLVDAGDRRFLFLNPSARKAIGLAPDKDVTGLALSEAHPPLTVSILSNEAFPAALKSGSWSGEGAWLNRDGSETLTSMMVLSHVDASGEEVFFSTISRDISDLKRAERLSIERATEAARAEELLRSKARMIQAVESTRREIAHSLHSSVQSKLIVLIHRLSEVAQGDAKESVEEITEVRRILSEVAEKDLDFLSQQLYPAILRRGLVPALQSLGDRFETALTIQFDVDDQLAGMEKAEAGLIREPVRLAAYRISENALTNVLKHSEASTVTIGLEHSSVGLLRLSIEDDGVGFAVDATPPGQGLAAMRDYAESVGGECVIRSDPGNGTRVVANLPAEEAAT